MSASSNTRWCPTPEQLLILEELYRRGLKTPNATQIQRITAHLSFYGKIQGKNVFYWFQNHKARDRQKLRKKLTKQLHQQQFLQQHHLNYHNYQHDPQPQYTHHLPSPFHQLSNCYSPPNLLHAQAGSGGTGVCEEAPEGLMRMRQSSWNWMGDLPKDCLMRSYINVHDFTMIMDHVGPPTFPNNNKPRPLQTLQLFPLRSPTVDQNSTTS